ncbi:hypothetical protein [Chromobacterium sp. ATCC 53434]|uniref:hypothetical protein n=1 Tax=Chromobacterium sp. (strain ATCC 53434 / SC 14030) TaxID=2059672 RepID=UPI00130534E6|nr:hypothetical protein [Chromobacterium sp. ATCC 53434]
MPDRQKKVSINNCLLASISLVSAGACLAAARAGFLMQIKALLHRAGGADARRAALVYPCGLGGGMRASDRAAIFSGMGRFRKG